MQDVYPRWHAADRELIETPEAWLTKVLTDICLDQLTSAGMRRESYVGQWLPEPVLALHIQVTPDKPARITRQWAAAGPHRPLTAVW